MYRTILPFLHLNQTNTHSAIINGIHSWMQTDAPFASVQEQVDDRLFAWAHYVVMPTSMGDIRPALIYMLKKNPKLKFVMDIDDCYHKFNHSHPADGKFTREMKINLVRNLSLCDFFSATTEVLANFYIDKIEHDHPTSKAEAAIIPNLLSHYLYEDIKPPDATFSKIRIGMIATKNHFSNARAVARILGEVQKKYGDKIELINFGWDGKWQFRNAFDRCNITTVPAVRFTDYFSTLESLKFDIGIIPLKNEPEYNKYKSSQRWLEFAGAGVPVIVGDSDVYASVIDSCALTALSERKWIDNLEYLINSKENRATLAYRAKEYVFENYCWNAGPHIQHLQEIFY